jgi:2-succinyl-6-hydroxy-2,4-cyclohexadiene-1-carboxylate synthase
MKQPSLHLRVRDLRYRVCTAGQGLPLFLLHGFTGSADTWFAHTGLAQRCRLIAIDLPGHGDTEAPTDPARYHADQTVPDLLALADALLGPTTPFALLGYSMGGRLALHVALAAPQRVNALILESASPGIASAGEREERRQRDAALAARIEREGLTAFVEYWEALPLFASQARLPDATRAVQRAQRLAQRPAGLANSLRGSGAGTQAYLGDRLPELPMPVLLITGALDAAYQAHATRMAAHLPDVRVATVADAGHAVHLEQPDVFDALVLDFLTAVEAARGNPTRQAPDAALSPPANGHVPDSSYGPHSEKGSNTDG